jgi:hypothetical protein
MSLTLRAMTFSGSWRETFVMSSSAARRRRSLSRARRRKSVWRRGKPRASKKNSVRVLTLISPEQLAATVIPGLTGNLPARKRCYVDLSLRKDQRGGAGEARKLLHVRLLELRAVNEDLQMMTRENQVAHGE